MLGIYRFFWVFSFLFFFICNPTIFTFAAPSSLANEDKEVQRLGEYVVSDSRLPKGKEDIHTVPSKATVITSADIRKSGAKNVQEAIQMATGIVFYDSIGNSFQQTIDIRGFNGIPNPGTSVFVDGVQVNEPDFNQVNFDLIPLETIERIEILPGPSALYGKNALAGVINIITKDGAGKRQVTTETAFGSFQRERYTVNTSGPIGEKLDYYFNFSRETEDGFRDESNARISRFFGKIGFQPFRGTTGDISYTYVKNRLLQASVLSLAEAFQNRNQTITPGDFSDSENNFIRFNGQQQLPFGFSAQVNAFYRRFASTTQNIGRTSFVSNTQVINESRGGTLQISHVGKFINHENQLVMGAEFTRHDISRPVFFSGPNNLNEDILGLLVRDAFHVLPNLIVVAGVRYEHDQFSFESLSTPTSNAARRFRRVLPRASVTYLFNPKNSVYFNFTEGFRPPQPVEMFGANINPNLKPSHSQNFEIGLKSSLYSGVEVTAAIFYTKVQDEIFFTCTVCTFGGPQPFDGLNRNIDQTRRRGIEVTVKGRFQDLFEGTINYTYVEAEFRSAVRFSQTEIVDVGDSLPLVPKNRLTFSGNVYPTNNLTVSLNGIYESTRFFRGDAGNTATRLPGYVVVNARVGYSRSVPGGQLNAYLAVNNIFDNEYFSYGIISSGTQFVMPAAPIAVFGGISYQFNMFPG